MIPSVYTVCNRRVLLQVNFSYLFRYKILSISLAAYINSFVSLCRNETRLCRNMFWLYFEVDDKCVFVGHARTAAITDAKIERRVAGRPLSQNRAKRIFLIPFLRRGLPNTM